MKQQITFITSNIGKFTTCQTKVNSDRVEVVQEKIDLPEIQSDQVREISLAKARYAYDLLQKPLIVQDSGFCIPALNNFPGPYVKYAWESLGSAGILRLMEGVEDRTAFFDMCLTYIDADGVQTFENKTEGGQLATEIHPVLSSRSWGALWEIYIPRGYDKPLAAFSDEELRVREENNWEMGEEETQKKDTSEFGQFARWLEGR